jgi:hypothetical protein
VLSRAAQTLIDLIAAEIAKEMTERTESDPTPASANSSSGYLPANSGLRAAQPPRVYGPIGAPHDVERR